MYKTLLVLSIITLTLGACANNSTTSFSAGTGDAVDPVKTQLFGDMPLPPGIKLNNDHSMILGGGNNWAGKVELNASQNVTDTYVFFKDQFRGAGWNLISATKSITSLLVFTKGSRTATIEIRDNSGLIGGTSVITLTVSPKDTIDALGGPTQTIVNPVPPQ